MFADYYVNSGKDIPDVPHYLLLRFSSISIPGDERSRTNPGHGYPARSEPIVKVEVYLSEDTLKPVIAKLEDWKESYKVLYVYPVDVTREMEVKLKINDYIPYG